MPGRRPPLAPLIALLLVVAVAALRLEPLLWAAPRILALAPISAIADKQPDR